METSKLYVSVQAEEGVSLDVTTYVMEVGNYCYVDNYNVTKVTQVSDTYVCESENYTDVVKACESLGRDTLEHRILEAVSQFLLSVNDPHLVSWVPEA